MSIGDFWEFGLELEGIHSRQANVWHGRETAEGTPNYRDAANDLLVAIVTEWISSGAPMHPDTVGLLCVTARVVYPTAQPTIILYGTGQSGEVAASEELPHGSSVLVTKQGHDASKQGRMYIGLCATTLEDNGILTSAGKVLAEAWTQAILVDAVIGATEGTSYVGGIYSPQPDPDPPLLHDIDYVVAQPAIASQRRRRNPHVPFQ